MSNSRVRQTLVRTTLVIGLSAGLAATLQGCVLAVAGAAARSSRPIAARSARRPRIARSR